MRRHVLWLVATCLLQAICGIAVAQEKPADFAQFNEFNAKPLEGWNWDKDDRLDDLIVQLQEKELSLVALDTRIAKATGKKGSAKMAENMAWRSTQRMDLNGGGPIRWDAFYGRNAENFFYHPVDPNTTYHTNTILQQVAPTSANGVAGNQGVPAHQRPPQFDYLYRGYEQKIAKAQRDAQAIESQVNEMLARRQSLEAQVVVLWTKIAFRVLDRDKVAEDRLVRWAVLPKKTDAENASERAVALTAATCFLAHALLFNDSFVENDRDKAFGSIHKMIEKHRRNFEDSLNQAETVLDESEDRSTSMGKYIMLARKLEDVSKQLTEGYQGWRDGEQGNDEPAKYAGLRRIQDSVVTYSKILLALHELARSMRKDWDMRINTGSTEFMPQWDVAYVAPQNTTPSPIQDTNPPVSPAPTGNSNGKNGPNTVFLSSLNATAKQLQNGWFEIGAVWDHPIVHEGKRGDHSIFLHAKPNGISSVRYQLIPGTDVFETGVIVPRVQSDQGNPATPLVFEVWGDGELLWRSQAVATMNQMQHCRVRVRGKTSLDLRVVCPGRDNWGVAVWFEPCLLGSR